MKAHDVPLPGGQIYPDIQIGREGIEKGSVKKFLAVNKLKLMLINH